MIREVSVCVLVMVGVVLGQNFPQQQYFNCPQPDGQFEYPQDCTQFWQCDGGAATLSPCQAQLIFNPQVGYCDWPHNVTNPGCARPGRSVPEFGFISLCRENPYGTTTFMIFIVAHPSLCNAFIVCSIFYSYCTFCGEGLYFSIEAGGCRDYLSIGQDRNALCQGRQFVEHADKVFRILDGSCPSSSTANP